MEKLKRAWAWVCEHAPLVEPAIFEKWEAVGVCSDGSTFTYRPQYYVRVSALVCGAPEYLAIDAKKDGYYRAGNTMYYLENIVRLEWRRVEQICNVIPYKSYNFKIIYSADEMSATIQAAKEIQGN